MDNHDPMEIAFVRLRALMQMQVKRTGPIFAQPAESVSLTRDFMAIQDKATRDAIRALVARLAGN